MNIEFCGESEGSGSFPSCCAVVLAALFLAGVGLLIHVATSDEGFDAPTVAPGATGEGVNVMSDMGE